MYIRPKLTFVSFFLCFFFIAPSPYTVCKTRSVSYVTAAFTPQVGLYRVVVEYKVVAAVVHIPENSLSTPTTIPTKSKSSPSKDEIVPKVS